MDGETRSNGGSGLLALVAGTIGMAISWAIIGYLKWLVRHPILGSLLILFSLFFGWMNWDVGSWPMAKYANMTVAEMNQKVTPDHCEGGDTALTCEYDHTTIDFTNGRATHFVFHDWEGKSYTADRSFERSILHSIGESYVEPTVADRDHIIWTNIDGLKEVRVTSDNDMNVGSVEVTVS